MNKKLKLFCFLMMIANFCFGESDGEKAFLENRPSDAVILLEGEAAAGTLSLAGYNYLGLSYFQTGDYEKSVQAFAKGLQTPGTNKKLLAFNQGNSYFALKDYSNAASSFSLALSADPVYYNALLNRANSYLMGNKIQECLEDYKKYIGFVPEDPQKDSIVELIKLLETELQNQEIKKQEAALEAQRMAEEEKRMQEEIAKRAEEERIRYEAEEAERQKVEAERKAAEAEKRAQEAERRRKLLEEVANSLQNTDSTNMSAGAEDLIDYETEAELD